MATSEGGEERKGMTTLRKEVVWPVIITVGLILVVLVNAFFIYIAVSGADPVAPSYVQGDR